MSNDKNNDFLKYRVYDRERGEYRAPEDFVLTMSGELYEVCIFSDEGGVYFEKVEGDRYIVERCIGLKDESDNPVFQGDVLCYDDLQVTITICVNNGVISYRYKDFIVPVMPNPNIVNDGRIIGTIHDPVYKSCEGDRC